MAKVFSVSVVADPAEWDALFSSVEHPHMTQAWAYGEARQAAGGHGQRRVIFDIGGWRARRIVFEREGEPVAICQLLDKPLAGISCGSRVNRGPLFLAADPEQDVVRNVYQILRRHGQCHRNGVLLLAPALTADSENYRMLAELGFRSRRAGGWCSDRVDLRLGEEQLRKNLASSWRNRLKAAERSGLAARVSQSPEDVEWIIDRHVENMRQKGFAGPSPALVRALCQAAPDDILIFQALLADEAVGGMLVYRFGHGAEYYVGWMGRKGRDVNVGNFLYWRVALELQRRGCRWLDLGGKRRGATEQFKRGMRGMAYELLNEWWAF